VLLVGGTPCIEIDLSSDSNDGNLPMLAHERREGRELVDDSKNYEQHRNTEVQRILPA